MIACWAVHALRVSNAACRSSLSVTTNDESDEGRRRCTMMWRSHSPASTARIIDQVDIVAPCQAVRNSSDKALDYAPHVRPISA